VKTIIGYGSPQQGTSKVHGNPLGEENLRKAKQALGWDPEKKFYVPEEAARHLRAPGERGAQAPGRAGKNASRPLPKSTRRRPTTSG
jgi:transketolase